MRFKKLLLALLISSNVSALDLSANITDSPLNVGPMATDGFKLYILDDSGLVVETFQGQSPLEFIIPDDTRVLKFAVAGYNAAYTSDPTETLYWTNPAYVEENLVFDIMVKPLQPIIINIVQKGN